MNYYVDAVHGSDTNDGQSPDAPWATLWRAFYNESAGEYQTYRAGDTLNLKRGCVWKETLYLNNTVAAGPIAVQPYGTGSEPSVINGGKSSAVTNATNVVAVMNVEGEADPQNVTRSIRLPAGTVLKMVDIGANPGASGSVTFAGGDESQTIALSDAAQYGSPLQWKSAPAGGRVEIAISVSPDATADSIALDRFVIGDPADAEGGKNRTIDLWDVPRRPDRAGKEPIDGVHYAPGSSDADDSIDFGSGQWNGVTVWDGECGLTVSDNFYPVSNWHLIGLELRSDRNAPYGANDTYGVLLHAESDAPCRDLLIQDCVIHNVSRIGISLKADASDDTPAFESPQIIGCDVYHAEQAIVLTGGARHKPSPFHSFNRVLISKCKTHDTQYCGIILFGGDASLITECEAYKTDLAPVPPNWCEAVGIIIGYCTDTRIEYCLAHDNNTPSHFGDGFDIMVSTNCVMQYNISWNNGWVGLLISGDNTCRYNLSWNDSMDADPEHCIPAALMIESAPSPWNTNTKVYNNTVVTFAPTTPPLFGYGSTHFVANNVFIVHSEHDAPLAVWDTLANAQQNTFRNNIYWRALGEGSVRFKFNDDSKNSSYITDFETWMKTVRGENELNQDPRLANVDSAPPPGGVGDFHLSSADSPCYRAGLDLSTCGLDPGPIDYYGKALPPPGGDIPPEIGAAQYDADGDTKE